MSQPNVSARREAVQSMGFVSDYGRVDQILGRRWGCSAPEAKKRRLRLAAYVTDVIEVLADDPVRQETFIDEQSNALHTANCQVCEADLHRLEMVADTDEDRAEGEFHLNPCPETRERHRRALHRQAAASAARARKMGEGLAVVP